MHSARPLTIDWVSLDRLRADEDPNLRVDRLVDARLASLSYATRLGLLKRKVDELKQTFVHCPRWAADRLPVWAWTALRLEIDRCAARNENFVLVAAAAKRRRARRAREGAEWGDGAPRAAVSSGPGFGAEPRLVRSLPRPAGAPAAGDRATRPRRAHAHPIRHRPPTGERG